MNRVIVSDTGPLIALALLNLLPVLPKLFASVYVPDGVITEATQDEKKPGARAIRQALESGLLLQKSVNLTPAFRDLIAILDLGEAEALALAKDLGAVALVDERRGRKVATKHGITVTGTAAVLVKAKKAGEIAAVKPLLDKLTQAGYRLSPSLTSEILKICGEP
ncbi:DUF3368 domain-containing protein [Pseudomaricurvus alcaniphilus]|uniref:DUF3368 domain-containing protein n=1 Tax=Pseudomaricurvus alcaniphilus TaxID=1166482 RepID=UPI00140CB093|nr:DUF3368 domain-containing protein [Pseudomaricurvus alcaniphilus]